MGIHTKAKAVAQIDAICDEYEQMYTKLALVETGDGANDFSLWLNRVTPDLRTSLEEELSALRQELLASRAKLRGLSTVNEIPQGVDAEVWKAVIQCQTFQPLSNEAKVDLAESIQSHQFSSGAILFRSGECGRGLCLITDGRVEVMGGEGITRQRFDDVGAGSVLGEMSLLTGHPCSADVIATTSVKTLVLSVEAFESLRIRHPELEIALSQLVSDRLGHQSQDALCGKSLGGFRLKRCINRGAMGVVYEAEDESDGSRRALKMLRHRFIYNPRIVSRFDQEADFLRQLEHPHIVSMRGNFLAYRTRFIVLDLYDGADLRTVLRRCGPLNESVARAVLGQIAAGLRYAHQQGVLHLDLKPANILVNQSGHIAITDFGLGQLIESDGCAQESVGTPIYMPPEQFTMTDVGPHCDWYSFACIAYELLSGERLFQADDSAHLIDDKFRVPSSSRPTLAASEEFQLHMNCALQPLVEDRDLDLDAISSWARTVPELAAVAFQETDNDDS